MNSNTLSLATGEVVDFSGYVGFPKEIHCWGVTIKVVCACGYSSLLPSSPRHRSPLPPTPVAVERAVPIANAEIRRQDKPFLLCPSCWFCMGLGQCEVSPEQGQVLI